jgi:hypothetical protein
MRAAMRAALAALPEVRRRVRRGSMSIRLQRVL